MIMRYEMVQKFPAAFEKLTGLSLCEFNLLLGDIIKRYGEAERVRRSRPDRKRAIGGGKPMRLCVADQLVLTLIWQRYYPRQDVLGHFFGISKPTVWRCIERIVPLLADRPLLTPKPSHVHRREPQTMAELLDDVPELVCMIGVYLDDITRNARKQSRISPWPG